MILSNDNVSVLCLVSILKQPVDVSWSDCACCILCIELFCISDCILVVR